TAVDGLVCGLPLLVPDTAGGEPGGRLAGGGGVTCRAEPLGQPCGEGREAELVGLGGRDHSPMVEQQRRRQPVALAHPRRNGPTGGRLGEGGARGRGQHGTPQRRDDTSRDDDTEVVEFVYGD